MDKQILKIALMAMCFAVCLTVNLLDENLIVRALTFLGGFFSGWTVCHSIWRIVEEISFKVEKP
jgi:hypothetical protein